MKYFKTVDGEYITAIMTGSGQTEISEAEYCEIETVIKDRPTAPDGYAYKLRADDLTWEIVELPPEPDDPTTEDKAEAYDILMGVES